MFLFPLVSLFASVVAFDDFDNVHLLSFSPCNICARNYGSCWLGATKNGENVYDFEWDNGQEWTYTSPETDEGESTLKPSNLLHTRNVEVFEIAFSGQDDRREKCLIEYYDGFWDDFKCDNSITCLCRQVDKKCLHESHFF